MMVQRYDRNLTFTLILHTKATARKGMDHGRQKQQKKPFSCHRVRLNLPSGKDYIQSYPWVSKVRKDGNVVSKVFIYVDGVRSLGWCNKEC